MTLLDVNQDKEQKKKVTGNFCQKVRIRNKLSEYPELAWG